MWNPHCSIHAIQKRKKNIDSYPKRKKGLPESYE